MTRFITLRRVNNGLGLVVICLAAYIFVLPFTPKVTWWVQHEAPIISAEPVPVLLADDPVPNENTLVIPKIDLRTTIYGGGVGNLNKGVWHTNSSTPEGGGNMVLAGHRFTYSNSAVFYNLDKLRTSDVIYAYWEGKRYEYIIEAINVVSPSDGTLIMPTPEPTLTIYTCTPLWSAKDRLVITAKMVEE